jgi:hypothetical protein
MHATARQPHRPSLFKVFPKPAWQALSTTRGPHLEADRSTGLPEVSPTTLSRKAQGKIREYRYPAPLSAK